MPKDYSKYTTKALLDMRYSGEHCYFGYDYMSEEERAVIEENRKALYAELNKREHIPNKEEGKKKRKHLAEMHRKSKKKMEYNR